MGVRRYAACLLIDGIDIALWTDEEAMSANAGLRTVMLAGMRRPSWSWEIDLQTGMMPSGGTTITVADLDGRWAEAMRPPEDEQETSAIAPGSAAAAAYLYGRHLAEEAIGPAGQRNYLPAAIGYGIGEGHDVTQTTWPVHTERSGPPVGRRCVLYVVELVDGAWQTVASDDPEHRAWWGTVRSIGRVDVRDWQIEIDGPQSWLVRDLAHLPDYTPLSVAATGVALPASWRKIGVYVYRQSLLTGDLTLGQQGYSSWDVEWDGVSHNSLITAINQAMIAAISDGVYNGTLTAAHDGIAISIPDNLDANLWVGNAYVSMHRLLWLRYGYILEGAESQSTLPKSDEYNISSFGEWWAPGEPPHPGPDYRTVLVNTIPVSEAGNSPNFEWDNNGAPRLYPLLYPGGVSVVPQDLGDGLQVELTTKGNGQAMCLGSAEYMIAGDDDTPATINVDGLDVDCNAQGLWAFYAPRRTVMASEVKEEVRFARCSWRDLGSGRMAGNMLLITEWIDPAAWGVVAKTTIGDWLVRSGVPGEEYDEGPVLLAVPLSVIGRSNKGQSLATDTLLRLMLSTGSTPGWSSVPGAHDPVYGDTSPAYLRGGANHATYDTLRRDLGLNIPASYVDIDAIAALAEDMPNDANVVAIALGTAMHSIDVLSGLLRCRGWYLSTDSAGRRYTIGRLGGDGSGTVLAINEETITDDAIAVTHDPFGLASRTHVLGRRHPVSGAWNETKIIAAATSKARKTGGEQTLHAIGTTGASLSTIAFTVLPPVLRTWERAWSQIDVTMPFSLAPRVGQRCLVTEPRASNMAGGYGLTGAPGIVTRCAWDLDSRTVQVTCLVDRSAQVSAPRNRMGPSALVLGYDADTDTLHCAPDWLSIGGLHRDVRGFAEPSWSSRGGDLDIEIWQWNGVAWSGGVTGTVASVDAGANTITLDGPWSGTLLRDTIKLAVAREYTEQTATWALQLLAAIADEAGEVDSDTDNAGRWG